MTDVRTISLIIFLILNVIGIVQSEGRGSKLTSIFYFYRQISLITRIRNYIVVAVNLEIHLRVVGLI